MKRSGCFKQLCILLWIIMILTYLIVLVMDDP